MQTASRIIAERIRAGNITTSVPQWAKSDLIDLNSGSLPEKLQTLGATYTRTGTAYRRDTSGTFKARAADVYAPDYDPLTGRWAYLAEPAQTNLVLHSSDATNAAWATGLAGTVVAAEGISGIEGGTCTKVTASATGSFRGQNVGTHDGSVVTNYAIIEHDGVTADGRHILLTASATVAVVRFSWSDYSVIGSAGTYGIVPLGIGPNGHKWCLVWLSGAGVAGQTRAARVFPDFAAGTGSCYIHHMQMVVGSTWTSPIVTAGSSVARGGDILTLPYTASSGTSLYVRYRRLAPAVANGRMMQLDDGSANNRNMLYTNGSAVVGETTVGGAQQSQLTLNTTALPFTAKAAYSAFTDNFNLSLNGAAATPDTSGTIPSVTTLRIGCDSSGANQGNIRILNFAAIPSALGTGQLQGITS